MSNPVIVQDLETGKFLGRGRGWTRKWVDDIQLADVWSKRGAGINAAKQTFTYRQRQELEGERFAYVEVRLEVAE